MEKTLQDLIKYAKSENWDEIDKIIPGIRNETSYQDWAIERGVYDRSRNVRDLAVSILQEASMPADKFKGIEGKLHELLLDHNIYVGFRSAFTLLNHNPQKYEKDELVRETVKRARNDDAVAEIAKGYKID